MPAPVHAQRCPPLAWPRAVHEATPSGPRPPRLLDRVREAIRARHYSHRTEKAYVQWIKRYILFHGKRHPAEMGAAEVTEFLTAPAVDAKVAASTQNQALSALLFLYQVVLGLELPWLDDVVRAQRPQHLPVVLTREEVRAVLEKMDGVPRLMAVLLYGSGLRLLECCRLRAKDVDLAINQLVVRDGKGRRDRVTMLPAAVKPALAAHLERVRAQHQADLRRGAGWVELPGALARKCPNAGREWVWQWVFPATRVYVDRASGQRRRHHLHESVLQRAVKDAVRVAGLVPQLPALVRHPPAGGRPRYPHRPGTPRPPGRQHHDDLYPRPQPRACWRAEPGRPDVPVVTRCLATRQAAGRYTGGRLAVYHGRRRQPARASG